MDIGTISITAYDEDGDKKDITDLYWFEENGIHDFAGDGHYGRFKFDVLINGYLVYTTRILK